MVTIYTTSLTFSNSTFCPHSVFMCFVWISEQTAIISLYSINWLVFITQTECVYCAVRTVTVTSPLRVHLKDISHLLSALQFCHLQSRTRISVSSCLLRVSPISAYLNAKFIAGQEERSRNPQQPTKEANFLQHLSDLTDLSPFLPVAAGP